MLCVLKATAPDWFHSCSTFLFSGEVWFFFFSAPSSSACRGSLLHGGAFSVAVSWLLTLHPVRSTPAAHHSYTQVNAHMQEWKKKKEGKTVQRQEVVVSTYKQQWPVYKWYCLDLMFFLVPSCNLDLGHIKLYLVYWEFSTEKFSSSASWCLCVGWSYLIGGLQTAAVTRFRWKCLLAARTQKQIMW